MNHSLLVLANGFNLGLAYLMVGLVARRSWPVVVLLMLSGMWLNRVTLRDILAIPRGLEGTGATLWRCLCAYTAMIAGRSLIEFTFAPEFASVPFLASDFMLKNVAIAFLLAISFLFSRSMSVRGAIWAMIIAVGFNAGANLLLDRMSIAVDNVYDESRFALMEARWRPPMARSNSFFAMSCTVAVGLFLNFSRGGIVTAIRRPVVLAALLVATTAAFWAAVKCQFRAQIPAFGVALILLFFRSRPVLRLFAFGGLSAMVLVPSLFVNATGYRVLDALAPERLLTSIGSSSTGAFDLSERTLLYEYGWANLQRLDVLFFGEGPMLRDALGALGETGRYTSEYRMPYHSAFLDFTMQSGLVIAVLMVMGLSTLLLLGFRAMERPSPQDGDHRPMLMLGLVNIILWLCMSIIDSGLSNLETLWFAIAPLFGALAESGRCQSPAMSRPTLDTYCKARPAHA